jgi:hypothetical protein
MFESNLMLPLTEYATTRSGVLHGESDLAYVSVMLRLTLRVTRA